MNKICPICGIRENSGLIVARYKLFDGTIRTCCNWCYFELNEIMKLRSTKDVSDQDIARINFYN